MHWRTTLRPAAVGLVATAAMAAAAAFLLDQLETDLQTGVETALVTVDDALVRVCLLALLGCLAWAWLATCAVVLEAWPGATAPAVPGVPLLVRRVVLAACGVALVGTLAAPAHAEGGGGHSSGPSLAGLPLPERALGPAGARTHPEAVRRQVQPVQRVTVRPGDSLWAIAAHDLPIDADDAAITLRWQRIYRLNRTVVGPCPDLILPGQVLRLPPAAPTTARPVTPAPTR
jgi:nucleoid-associated protein YgaU